MAWRRLFAAAPGSRSGHSSACSRSGFRLRCGARARTLSTLRDLRRRHDASGTEVPSTSTANPPSSEMCAWPAMQRASLPRAAQVKRLPLEQALEVVQRLVGLTLGRPLERAVREERSERAAGRLELVHVAEAGAAVAVGLELVDHRRLRANRAAALPNGLLRLVRLLDLPLHVEVLVHQAQALRQLVALGEDPVGVILQLLVDRDPVGQPR